jgi:hypothetical protein
MATLCPPSLQAPPPPPAIISATVAVSGAAPSFTGTFAENDGLGPTYIYPDGTMCFSKSNKPVNVKFTFVNNTEYKNLVLYSHNGITPITFSDDATVSGKTAVPTSGHHQFGKSVTWTGISLSFTYHNDNHGQGGNNGAFNQSRYGIYFADSPGHYIGQVDPTINNGGNNN